MLLQEIVRTSATVAGTRSRNAKVAALAATLRQASADEVEIAASYLSGTLRQRRIGIGWRTVADRPPPATVSTLTMTTVDDAFERLSTLSGAGAQGTRAALLADLMGRATAEEQHFLTALITGETRQGALDGVMLQAVAAAFGLPEALVRRAAMFAGTTAEVARAALVGGSAAVAGIDMSVGRPLRPMLAGSAPDVATALAAADPTGAAVAVEAKLDGIRIQVHKGDSTVRVFTRSLDEITGRMPEIERLVARLPVPALVLDGEAIALGADGRPRPFQETAARSASRATAPAVALSPFFFDMLHLDGVDLVDVPLGERAARLVTVVPRECLVERTVTGDRAEAEAFLAQVLAAGHEGVVVKGLWAAYEAGRRGTSWVKVKPVHTLDLVVLAVEWGSGRRRGLLSNIHLGARDSRSGGWVMLGKTFKGMTDEMLAWQTRRFLELQTRREGHVVHLRPEQVVEIAFDGIQRSSRYPGGMALRFARVLRYRDDKSAAEADTVDAVRAIAERGYGGGG